MKRALLLAALVVACQAPNPLPAPSPSPTGVRGGTLVVADYEWPATLDPLHATTESELRLTGLLYEPLWTFDPDLKPVPRLLSAMPVAKLGPGGTMSLDLRIRPDARWSDGSPLTADDVIKAASAISSPISSQERKSWTEVIWRFTDVYAAWLTLGPRVVPERPNLASGPFQVAGEVPGRELQLSANPYSSPKPFLDGITYRVFDGKAAEISALQTGEADLGFHLLPADFLQLVQVPGSRSLTISTLRAELLVSRSSPAPPVDRAELDQSVFSGSAALDAEPLPLPPMRTPAASSLKGSRFSLLAVCDDQVRQQEQADLAGQWTKLGASVDLPCEPRASYFARLAKGDFQLALFSYDFQPAGDAWRAFTTAGSAMDFSACADPTAGCLEFLYRWPEAVQATARLHGLDLNPVAGLDTWNAADWWLTPSP